VSELERDMGTATVDLATADRQFSQVSNQLQVVSKEATRLRESNTKLSEDLEGELCGRFLSLSLSMHVFLPCSDSFRRRARVLHTGMTTKLAEVKQELNTALLKVIEKDGATERLSEQLQSECRALVLSSFSLRICHNLLLCSSSRDLDRAGAIADGAE
jgi:hypothetical protein